MHALAGLLYSFGFSIVFIQHPLVVSQGTRDGVTGRGHIFRRTGRGHIFICHFIIDPDPSEKMLNDI